MFVIVRKSRLFQLCMLVIFMSGMITFQAHAQAVAGGQIHGGVTDPNGAGLQGAVIRITNTDTALLRSVTSGADGSFIVPNLPVGNYLVQVESAGFSSYQQSGIELRVGQDLLVNVRMSIGTVTENVVVSGSATDVQTEETSISEVIDRKRIVDLPLNGRQATQLILLSGAATTAPAGDLNTTKNYPSAVTISVAGGQANGTNYLLDGGDNNDSFSNVNLPFPFPDALQEFSVETTGLAARYGLHPGAVVSVITKSGTNKFHGSLFEFIRNGDLNARNFFAAARDTLRRNQFGGTIEGPIRKDKVFFFFGYQGTQTRSTPPNSTSFVPNAAMLNGDFSTFESASCRTSHVALALKNPATGLPYTNNQIPTGSFNASALSLLKYLPQSSDPCGKIIYGIPNPSSEAQYLGRVDWNRSSRESVFVRYFIADYNNPAEYGGNLLNTTRAGLSDRSQSVTVGDTYAINAQLLNSFHVTATRLAIGRGTAAGVINPQTIGIPVNVPVPNYIGLSVSGDFTVGGTIPSRWVSNTWQLAEDLDWVRGKHHFTAGVDWIHNQLNSTGAINENGVFTFNGQSTGDSMADFLLGDLSDFTQGNPTGVNFRQNYIGLYAQDDVHLSSGLNAHIGLRWEPFLPVTDTLHRGGSFSADAFTAGTVSNVYVNAPAGLLFYGDKGIPKGYVHSSWLDFEPRVGLAWDPLGKGKESIRASYSMGYDTPEIFYEARYGTNAPFGSTIDIPSPSGGLSNPYLSYPGGNPFPLPSPPSRNATFPALGAYVVQPLNLHPTYMQQWNLSYQQTLGDGWLLSGSYIGAKTTHIWIGTEENPAVYIPGTCGSTACSTTANTNQRRKLYLQNPVAGAAYSTIGETDDGANGNYNGLLISVQHRFNKYYSILSNYTWSHCLSSGNFAGDVAGPSYQNPSNRDADYANCSFDVRHNFNFSVLAVMPRLGPNWTRMVFGNWQFAPLMTANSGTYFTPTTGTDQSLTGVGLDRPNVIGNPYVRSKATRIWVTPAAFSPNAIGTFGNAKPFSLAGPHFVDVDAAFGRTFTVKAPLQIDFRSEFFNLLNHTNFINPSANLSSSSFGQLLSAGDPRILQFSLKVLF